MSSLVATTYPLGDSPLTCDLFSHAPICRSRLGLFVAQMPNLGLSPFRSNFWVALPLTVLSAKFKECIAAAWSNHPRPPYLCPRRTLPTPVLPHSSPSKVIRSPLLGRGMLYSHSITRFIPASVFSRTSMSSCDCERDSWSRVSTPNREWPPPNPAHGISGHTAR